VDQLSLHLLGGFAVDRNGQHVELPPACQRVVTLVALKRRPVHRLWVCATLWPHAQTRRAVAGLRSATWRLRPLGVETLLAVDPPYLQLGTDVPVDWLEALDLMEQLRAGNIDPQLVAELLPLLRAGELLDRWAEPWVTSERDRYHGMRMTAVEILGHAAEKPAPHVAHKVIRTAHSRRTAVPTRRDSDDASER
jgi:DNA-binding SARP family transcriptional activator